MDVVEGAPPPGKRRERSVESLSDEVGWSWYQWRLFIVTGLCVSAESIEVNLLSFISIEATREWQLEEYLEESVSAAVFVGMVGPSASSMWSPWWLI